MNREEAIRLLDINREHLKNINIIGFEDDIEALDMAIKALEQEPCEDCISRKAVLDNLSELNAISFYEAQEDSKEAYYEIQQMIKSLQPAIPQPKTDILDKIRAEIEQEYNRLSATRDETLELGECLGLKMSLKIIDKYKTESEDKE